jgi:hypothetical protein
MPPGDPPGDSFILFAAGVIGLEPGPDPAETRSALFRKLLDDDFLPDPLAHEAILALAGRPLTQGSLLAEEASEAERRRLHRDVEQFASAFFDLPISSRVEQFRMLSQACAQHPSLIERLMVLRPALMVARTTVTDPSPLVKALLDDILDLCVLRPGPRSVEARARAERFRSDPNATDAARERALKHLKSRHPAMVALLPDYPAGLTKVRRRGSADRVIAEVVGKVVEPSNPLRRAYVVIAVVLLSGVGRLLATKTSSTPMSTPSNYLSAPKIKLPAAKSDAAIADAIRRYLRDEFKKPIRRELARAGKSIDEPRLNRLVAQLPVEQLSQVGGMASVVLSGQWTETARDLFIVRLKTALKEAKVGLSDAEIDDLAPRCVPQATPRGKP